MRLFTLIIWVLLSMSAFAQSWAPIGAQWHYENQYFFRNEQGFFHFESIKDTTVLGKNCREIHSYSAYGCLNRSNYPIFTYQSNDSVYFLNYIDSGNPSFQLHFKWDSKPGDAWLIAGLGPKYDQPRYRDSIIVRVDSIDKTIINGVSLRRLFVSQLYLDSTSRHPRVFEYIEGIGDTKYMFATEWESGGCDEEFPVGLRCYQDTNLGLYMPILSDSCDQIKLYSSIVENQDKEGLIKFYPNPVSSELHFETDLENIEIEIYDAIGQMVIKQKLSNHMVLDVSVIKNGLYTLLVYTNENNSSSYRLIKN